MANAKSVSEKREEIRTEGFEKPTRAMGLLYFFIALWILSIFGNYGDWTSWHKAKQVELFHWALLFGVAAIAALFHGVRADDAMSRGFGLTFLFINLYTRFFEHFRDHLHKAIFFRIKRQQALWTSRLQVHCFGFGSRYFKSLFSFIFEFISARG